MLLGGVGADGVSPRSREPCCFYNPGKHISLVVHGDDFTALGGRAELAWYGDGLRAAFGIKVKGHLGESDDCENEPRVLNRIVRIDDQGLRWEADPRHAEMLLDAIPIGTAVTSPGVRGDEVDHDAVLDEEANEGAAGKA